MSFLGNVLWFICGGFISAIMWFLAGILWSITIFGIPVGVQCFKMASLSMCPFGRDVEYDGGAFSFIINVIWFFVSGLELFVVNFVFGLILCITIIGIPFGKQFFKIAKLSLCPFGARIVEV
ncbi:MAG: YccF domain-containing protein [Lachnospiraceae bacterium]|nr:YccF domain-containing protein [Lachnospiraceae bacterium]